MAETSTYKREVPKIIDVLFKGLQIDYPGFIKGLDEKHTRATKRRWAAQLMHYSDERIMDALNRCPDNYPRHVPTIGEFKALCKQHPAHTPVEPLKLEMLKSSDQVGREAIDGLYDLIGKATVDDDAEEMTEEQIAARKTELHEQIRQHEEGQAS